MANRDADRRAETPEARRRVADGIRESMESERHKATARTDPRRPEKSQTMEAVVERGNMSAALKRVEANKGAAGVDGMSAEALRPWLRANWPRVKEELLKG